MMAAASASGEKYMSPPVDTKWKPHLEIAPNCPRCASANTKFCYYNNYSLSQPRYFCKGCRRYWTKGGSLRNVPVGGGCRKTRRSSKSSRSSARATQAPEINIHGGSCSGGSGDSSSSSAGRSGSDIDMAVVFANFLNPDSAAVVPEAAGLGLIDHGGVSNSNLDSNSNSQSNSISSTPESGLMMQEGILFPPSYELGEFFHDDRFLEAAVGIGGGDVYQEEQKNQEMMINALGLQTLLSDEMAHLESALWSSTAVGVAGNDPVAAAAAWEPPQEQGGFDAGDFGMTTTTAANNWGCYDILQGSFDIFHAQRP